MKYCYSVIILFLFTLQVTMAQTSFSEVASSRGIHHNTMVSNFSGGVSFRDFDGDGWDDLTLGSGTGHNISFYKNVSGTFTPVTFPSIEMIGETKQIIWVDYDNDGDKDLYVANNEGGNFLFNNNGSMSFTDVTSAANLPTTAFPTWVAAWGDYDRDGWLDLYFTNYSYGTVYAYKNYLYRNNGDGTFSDVTIESNSADGIKSPLGVAFMDYDNDMWPDIYIGHDKMHGNVLLRNLRNGKFGETGVAANAKTIMCAMCVSPGDYDNNGYLDIYVTNSPPGNSLLQNNGDGTFTQMAAAAGVGFYEESWGAQFVDFDNDLDQDLYVSGPVKSEYYDNNGAGMFSVPVSAGLEADTMLSYANAIGDIDNDGYPDLVVNNKTPDSTQLWLNGGSGKNYLKIQLQGTMSNRDGVGSWVELYEGGTKYVRFTLCGSSFIGQNSEKVFFGLDTISTVDSVIVRWPSGHVDKMSSLASNQTITIIEGCCGAITPSILPGDTVWICPGDTVRLMTGLFDSCVWSTSDTGRFAFVSAPGSYTATVTDSAFGTIVTDPVVVMHNTVAPVMLDAHDGKCFGDSNGYAVVLTPDSAANYYWSNGAMGDTISGLPTGLYTCTKVDMNGCEAMDSITVDEPAPLFISAILGNPLCNGDANGSIELLISGGSPGYTVYWGIGDTASIVTGLGAGWYSYEVFDSNLCFTGIDSVELTEPDTFSLGSFATPASGGGATGTAGVTVTGGTPPYSFLWNDALSQTDSVAINLTTGTYTCYITDANGCVDSIDVFVDDLVGMVTGNNDGLIQIYPNPANDVVVIESSVGATSLELYNAAGVRIRTYVQGLSWKLDLSGLADGLYFIRAAEISGKSFPLIIRR